MTWSEISIITKKRPTCSIDCRSGWKIFRGTRPASGADIATAHSQAEDLWDALNTTDQTGKVVARIKAEVAGGNSAFKNSLGKAIECASVKDITGVEFEEGFAGKPLKVGDPKFQARGYFVLNLLGYAGDVYNEGWKDATFDLLDVTGVGRQYLEMQSQGPPVA